LMKEGRRYEIRWPINIEMHIQGVRQSLRPYRKTRGSVRREGKRAR
jgi:hypothetical protein